MLGMMKEARAGSRWLNTDCDNKINSNDKDNGRKVSLSTFDYFFLNR